MLEEMIRALRRTRLALSPMVFGIVAVMVLTVSSSLHQRGDDRLCEPGTGTGGYGAPQLATATPPAHAGHCVLCHAAESLQAQPSSSRFGPSVEIAIRQPVAVPAAPAASGRSTAPARAPPTA